MILTLYKTADDNAVVSKTLTSVATVPVIKPTEGVDLDTPALVVQYNTAALTANYGLLEIKQNNLTTYSAYYFIKQRDVFPAEKITLHCEIDVLQTYAAGIRDSIANVIRSQSEGISYVRDEKYPINPSQFVLTVKTLKEGVFKTQQPFRLPNYIVGVNTSITG